MRVLAVTLLLALGSLAGCLQDVQPTNADADRASSTDAELAAALEDMPQFCEDAETGYRHPLLGDVECKFWDDRFHEYVVYDVDTTVIDVVIVPPAGMTTPDQIATSRLAVQAWSDGIEALGAEWFTDAFEMNVYAVGVDVPSLDAVSDPEIVVLSTSAAGVGGIGLEPKQITCQIIGEDTLVPHDGHVHTFGHATGYVTASDCTNTGFTCFAVNGGRTDPQRLYDLIAHEVGHCLGAGHVGDALDFRARYAPVEDIMSYQSNPEHVHCVSNMNVRNLEGIYAHLLDRPESEWLPRGSFMDFPVLEYAQVRCENPPGM